MKEVDKVGSMFLRAVVKRMKELGLNKSTLAERMKISRPYVVKVLRGDVNISLGSAARFAKALEMDFVPTLVNRAKSVRKSVASGGGQFIASLTKNLFWDVDPATIDTEKNRRYVIERVLERGGLDDIRSTLRYYTMPVVVEEARAMRSLSPKALSLVSCITNTPREQFRCYTSKQSSSAPWIY